MVVARVFACVTLHGALYARTSRANVIVRGSGHGRDEFNGSASVHR